MSEEAELHQSNVIRANALCERLADYGNEDLLSSVAFLIGEPSSPEFLAAVMGVLASEEQVREMVGVALDQYLVQLDEHHAKDNGAGS